MARLQSLQLSAIIGLGCSQMYRFPKSALVLTVVLSALAHPRAIAQIAHMPDTPAAAPAVDSPAVGTPGSSGSEPRAVIRGWSPGSELAPSSAATGQEIRFDPGTTDVVFFFDAVTVPGTTAPIEFRYRMTDYDGDWSVTRDKIAHYRHLPPGSYSFEVEAHTVGQPWDTAIANLSLEQRPFFYQTWYFYTLLALALVAVAIETLRQRDQLLKGQIAMVLEERNRIARDCHDTLMAGFAAISWQLEATSRLLSDPGDRTSRASQSCELARKMLTHCQADARRIIWDLRDSDEITNILSQALSRALNISSLRENPEIDFAVEGEEIPIAPTAVHHLVCIGQEAVTNAIRHSGCSTVHVRLNYDSECLNLAVRDNGYGFQVPESGIRNGHFGIQDMKERSRKLGGTFRIQTSPGLGTEVGLKVGFRTIHPLSDQEQHVVPWIGV
jgi:signal transduction histidine kinase